MKPCGSSPAGPCSKVVDRWMGGATDAVTGSRSAPAWTASVSNLMNVPPGAIISLPGAPAAAYKRRMDAGRKSARRRKPADGTLARLRHALQALALPAETQAGLLPGFVLETDELALNFDHGLRAAGADPVVRASLESRAGSPGGPRRPHRSHERPEERPPVDAGRVVRQRAVVPRAAGGARRARGVRLGARGAAQPAVRVHRVVAPAAPPE